jgi:small-conductance mechanosensitive channel
MSSAMMELEDYYLQLKAENGALKEQIDNLVAALRSSEIRNEEKDKTIANKDEQLGRLTLALDDALGLQRARLTEKEALEL